MKVTNGKRHDEDGTPAIDILTCVLGSMGRNYFHFRIGSAEKYYDLQERGAQHPRRR